MRKALLLLGTLDDSDMDWLIRTGSKRHVPAGTVLIQMGRQLDSLFVVLEGGFAVLASEQKEIARLAPGDVLGEISFVDSRPPSATVRASVDSAVLAVPRSELNVKLAEDPGFASRFYKSVAVFLADRLRSTTSQLGYGPESRLDENAEDLDEMPPHLMDVLHSAGSRFVELQRRAR